MLNIGVNKGLYVQYGCGLSCPEDWINFDSSPTLRIQRNFLLNLLLNKHLNVLFPKKVRYGDIVKGLKIKDNSCDGIYCSHILEHLSYVDLLKSIKNTYNMLKFGGVFRMVVPDMEYYCREYLSSIEKEDPDACIRLMQDTLLGKKERKKSISQLIQSYFGNSEHLWMWDYLSIRNELLKAGFKEIRRCKFNDSKDKMFLLVEDTDRFKNCLSVEAIK